jgi:hypothetical protein
MKKYLLFIILNILFQTMVFAQERVFIVNEPASAGVIPKLGGPVEYAFTGSIDDNAASDGDYIYSQIMTSVPGCSYMQASFNIAKFGGGANVTDISPQELFPGIMTPVVTVVTDPIDPDGRTVIGEFFEVVTVNYPPYMSAGDYITSAIEGLF